MRKRSLLSYIFQCLFKYFFSIGTTVQLRAKYNSSAGLRSQYARYSLNLLNKTVRLPEHSFYWELGLLTDPQGLKDNSATLRCLSILSGQLIILVPNKTCVPVILLLRIIFSCIWRLGLAVIVMITLTHIANINATFRKL